MGERWRCVGEANPEAGKEYVVRIADDGLDGTKAVLDAMHVRLRGRVIRCEDCRLFDPGCHSDVVDGISVTHIDIDPWCRLPGMMHDVRPDGFCSWAEPREEQA